MVLGGVLDGDRDTGDVGEAIATPNRAAVETNEQAHGAGSRDLKLRQCRPALGRARDQAKRAPKPPSTPQSAPVTKDAASDAINMTTSAISTGSAMRRSACAL